MWTMIIKRLLRGVVTVILVAVLVFIMLRVLPGDAASLLAGTDASIEHVEELRKAWGLDKSIPEQFAIYVSRLISGDAGMSYQYATNAEPTVEASYLVWKRIPNTLKLAGAALFISIAVAIPLGVFSALKPGSWIDNAIMATTFTSISFPVFFIGILLMYVFALWLKLLPTGGSGSFRYIVLPAVTLSAHTTAQFTRVTRTEVGRVLRDDYIRTARAKGMSERVVIVVHGLRNALIPLITVIGIRLSSLLTGAVIIETLFRWPGLGNLLITSLQCRDYPVIQLLVPYTAAVFIMMNTMIDILYGVLDPRIRV